MITLAVGAAIGAVLGWFARGWTLAPVALPQDVLRTPEGDPLVAHEPAPVRSFVVPLLVCDATYAIVSDAGDVRFPQDGEDGTNGGAAKRAWEAVTANPDGQLWTFYHDGAVRGRTGVVS